MTLRFAACKLQARRVETEDEGPGVGGGGLLVGCAVWGGGFRPQENTSVSLRETRSC